MDHFLEDDCELGKDLDLLLWGQISPDVSGIGWHKTS